MTRFLSVAAAASVVLLAGINSAPAVETSRASVEGKSLLQTHCARCHSIAATGESPLREAPPLRQIYLRDPIEELEGGFAEGMGSKHRDMPQIQFSDEQVSAILNYLGSITGVDPATRQRAPIPRETPP